MGQGEIGGGGNDRRPRQGAGKGAGDGAVTGEVAIAVGDGTTGTAIATGQVDVPGGGVVEIQSSATFGIEAKGNVGIGTCRGLSDCVTCCRWCKGSPVGGSTGYSS